MQMRIIIPTRGRTNGQLTLSWLPKELREHTTLVCPKREHFTLTADLYRGEEVVIQPDPTWKIAAKRQWIMEEWARRGYEKIIMLDDDLRFSTRISETDWHLRESKGKELIPEFERIENRLGEEFPHAGFGPRQGNDRLKDVGWHSPGKMCYTLGYYLPVVLKEVELNRIDTREDMDVTLQLLRKGYPDAIWNTTVVDQRKYDAPGGASSERTVESSDADAERLAQLHPGYVSVTYRKYEASKKRKEVICQWQKAYEDGKKYREASLASGNVA